MTAQIPDSVGYEGTEFAIAGINGSGLFDPLAYDIRPIAPSTANWRGYVASYEVRGERLHLDRLTIGKDSRDIPLPALFGVSPDLTDFDAEYEFDEAPMDFSGGLLLGDEFVHELYVHMGFHPAWKYRRVMELIFENGALLRSHDHSERIAEIRGEIVRGTRPDPDADPELIGWIDRTFELGYGRTFG